MIFYEKDFNICKYYNDYIKLIFDLYNGVIDAAIVPGNFENLVKNEVGFENIDSDVKKVFEFLITKGITNDSQNFLPEGILKDKTSNVKNYPVSTKNADMTGIEDINVKSKLTELWKQVNG